MGNRKLLLHSCCGPCSSAVIERLLGDGYDVSVFYYNPNITDEAEYLHRKSEQLRLIDILNAEGRDIKVVDADYDPSEFYKAAEGLEDEPEGGKRCAKCFWLRLYKTAKTAKDMGFGCFDTTLTVSPYKNYAVISGIGSQIATELGIEYLGGNYKKQDGYKRSIELSNKYGLYRQHYCGCGYSEAQAERQRAERQDRG